MIASLSTGALPNLTCGPTPAFFVGVVGSELSWLGGSICTIEPHFGHAEIVPTSDALDTRNRLPHVGHCAAKGSKGNVNSLELVVAARTWLLREIHVSQLHRFHHGLTMKAVRLHCGGSKQNRLQRRRDGFVKATLPL